jgi:replicative superfamily II helicase
MSATMPNFRQLADWLHAASFETTFRPVPLAYNIKARARVLCAHHRSLHRPHLRYLTCSV